MVNVKNVNKFGNHVVELDHLGRIQLMHCAESTLCSTVIVNIGMMEVFTHQIHHAAKQNAERAI